MIIGLTGPNASGKGEVARSLENKGFVYYSLSDIVREEATNRGLEISRENLISVGNSLRLEYGAGVLSKRVKEKVEGNCVVDSIRNPSEVEELRLMPNFMLLGIDAPIEIRFQRACKRGRVGEGVTLEEFARKEDLENSKDPKAQQLKRCLKMADKLILNDGSIEVLQKRVMEVLNEIQI